MAARIWDWMHHPLTASEPTSQRKTKFIGNATELDEAGIDFLGQLILKQQVRNKTTPTFNRKPAEQRYVAKTEAAHFHHALLRQSPIINTFVPTSPPSYQSISPIDPILSELYRQNLIPAEQQTQIPELV
ncbi:hypothetical protein V6N11_027218 [Hibiscus sabdariffa]|uniref:Uncharacterized protein n=1 Tax=Hibiscus sabdariffa TaxID=183260 RepID=A0ABR2PGQ2_9ROSI